MNELRISTGTGLRELHLFAGAGGGILGGMLLGHTCVCAVEIEPYRRKVLLQRQRDGILPKFPIWDDVRTFDGKPWRGRVDVVAGGFPCQDISIAKQGANGIEGERSGLWKEQLRVICDVRPKFGWVENSAALLVRGLGTVLKDLAEIGYNARWDVFRAGELGAWHDRPRLFILAFDPLQVRIKRQGKRSGARSLGPWRETGEKRLREILEAPTSNQGADKPLLSGTEYGLANWVDRVEAIGDGQVPSVVKLAWETLSEGLI